MKRNVMMITMLLFIAGVARAQTSNFTGSWRRNDAQTDAGGLSVNTVARTLDISADTKILYVKAVLGNAAGEVHTSVDTLNLDGTEHTLVYANKRKKRSVLNWSADKKQLTTVITIFDPDGTIVQNWKQTYSNSEGKILKIALELNMGDDNFQLMEVFDKQ